MPGTDEPVELPDGLGYWTRPATGPSWSTAEVAQFFYGVEYPKLLSWLREDRRWVDFDGRPVQWATTGTGTGSGNKRWRLRDIEVGAHVLAAAGKIGIPTLARAVGIVKLVAQQHGVAVEFEPLRLLAPDRGARRPHGAAGGRREPVLHDAVTGEPGALPRYLAVGGNQYEIALTDAHWAEVIHGLGTVLAHADVFYAAPDPYHATRAGRAAIRAWAREHGYPVGDRARISAEVLAAYRAAMMED